MQDRQIILKTPTAELLFSYDKRSSMIVLTYDEVIVLRDDLNYCIDVLKPKTLWQSLHPNVGDV